VVTANTDTEEWYRLSAGFREASHQTPQFLANDRIDVSLVILREDFEIDEKLCTLAVSFHSLVNLCR